MIPQSTVQLLRAWGNWGRTQNIGYPRLSPMFGERALKTPLYGSEYAPPDILEIEQAVCRIDNADRWIIIQRYQWREPLSRIAGLMGATKSTAHRRLDGAQWAVHIEMGKNPCNRGTISIRSMRQWNSVTQPLLTPI